jgi:anaerobic selenocysteine-containing dehydrogenase
MSAVEHRTYCRICPVQCGIVVTVDAGRVLDVRGDPQHPVSQGYTCPKGRAAGDLHHHPRRLDAPRLRGREEPWPVVLDDLARTLAELAGTHGPDAVAVYHGTWSWMDAHGRAAVEALVRHLGTRSRYSAVSVDAIARIVVSQLLTGGPGLLPALDVDDPGLTVLVGTNPVVSHGHASALVDPVRTLRRIAAGPGLWVVDPRRTATAELATTHLAIRPGADPALLAHLVRELLRDGADHAYLRRYAGAADVDTLRAAVEPFDSPTTAARTGLDAADVAALVAAVRAARRVSVLTGTGATMAANAALTEWLAAAVHVVTGSLEAPGGPWCNPGLLQRADLVPPRTGPPSAPVTVASRPDLPVHIGERPCAALADEIEAGTVRALLVVGGDPLTALPDTDRLTEAFARLDVLAVADVLESDTVRAATHVLATAGMFERRDLTWYTDRFAPVQAAQRTDAVLTPAHQRRTVEDVVADLAGRLGAPPVADLLDRAIDRAGEFRDRTVVVAAEARPRGWFHERGLAGGRWQLAPEPLVERLASFAAAGAPAAADAPAAPGGRLLLVPRRTTHRMNSLLADVRRGSTDHELWVHPADAVGCGIGDGDRALVRGPSGVEVEVIVRVTDRIGTGTVSLPHGLRGTNVNRLTSAQPGHTDPLTGMVTQSGVVVALRASPGTFAHPPATLPT